MLVDEDVYLEHYGKKGMKWGVRNARVTGTDRKEGRQEMRDVAKSAREIIKQSRNASTPAERKIAADRYKKEVVDRVKSPQFKAKYQAASTMGKGETVAHVLVFGPFAAATIPATRAAYNSRQTTGLAMERAMAQDILKEMRS